MADNLSFKGREFLEAACKIADRFNEYQVDEEALIKRLGWDDQDEFSRVRGELEDAGCIVTIGAAQGSAAGTFWIKQAGRDQCPEPLGGRDALQIRD
jgi:hypothetical protein